MVQFQAMHDTFQTPLEFSAVPQKTHHDSAALGDPVKLPRVNHHSSLQQKIRRLLLFIPLRQPQNDTPPGVKSQNVYATGLCHLVVLPNPFQNLSLDRPSS